MPYQPAEMLERMMMNDPVLARHMSNIGGHEEYRRECGRGAYLFSSDYRKYFYSSDPTPEEAAKFEEWRRAEVLFWEWEHEDAMRSKVPAKPIPFPDRIHKS